MVSLQNKLQKSLAILNDGEKKLGLDELALGPQLSEEFSHIMKIAAELATSRRIQFFSESEAVY